MGAASKPPLIPLIPAVIMATFYANPDDQSEPWIEKAALDGYGFRNWHLMFFCFSGVITLLVLVCCCVKFRIPRTKQEIDGDYRRRKLAEKFQERLQLIHNQDMDVLDLQQALKIIQEDFDNENRKIREKSELEASKIEIEENPEALSQPDVQQPKFAKKFAAIMLAAKVKPSTCE